MAAGPGRDNAMNKTIIILILSVVITVLAAACGEQEIVLSESSAQVGTLATEAAQENVTEAGEIRETSPLPTEPAETLYVYVCGEVVTPGVYALAQGARIYEAVTLAGGLTEDADAAVINQAETVTDGMMIRIPAVGSETAVTAAAAATGQVTASDGTTRIDINTADAAALMTLPGIGESKAAAIIAWRQENGGFTATEDLKNVSGIGDSTYERLSSLITVTP